MRHSTFFAAFIMLSASHTAAFAQSGPATLPPMADSEPAPLLRILPVPAASSDDTVIQIGAVSEIATRAAMPNVRVFENFDDRSELTRADKAAIEAEIAFRFGKTPRITSPQTGLQFTPDLTMVLKPLQSAGKLRNTDSALFDQ